MRKFVTITFAVITIFLGMTANAETRKGEKSVGLLGGYTTIHKAPIAGLYFQYRFAEHFRLSPAINYYFRHYGTDAFSFNVNADFPFAVSANGKWSVYPIAGLNFTSWNIKSVSEEKGDDSTSRKNKLGINVGGGVEYYVSPTLKLALEAKYGWVKHYDGGIFNLSIGYVF